MFVLLLLQVLDTVQSIQRTIRKKNWTNPHLLCSEWLQHMWHVEEASNRKNIGTHVHEDKVEDAGGVHCWHLRVVLHHLYQQYGYL